uniref:Alpha-lactalbumin n=1 Tax=Capra hircus TaxID=9925 RepID=A0A8C2NHQ7_CAPHI
MPGPLRLFPQIKGGILFHATQAEQLTKCEVFQKLKDLKDYGGVSLPEWVCTAFHTSGYDTQAIVQNNDSTEYGLFQINNKIWCKDDQNPHSRNICNISCDSWPIKHSVLRSWISGSVRSCEHLLSLLLLSSFCSWNSSAPWLPRFASLYPLEANSSLSPGPCSDDGHVRTNLQGCVNGARDI